MPPIPIHLDAPITPEKPHGITPQTTNPSSNLPPPTTTTTTAAPPPNPQSASSPARPGAAAVPAPTPFAQPQPTRTTQQQQQNGNENKGPPAPQPGAVPLPPGQTQGQASTLPPPPRPGEAAKMREASVTAMPAQMGIPAPSQGYGATRSTTTTAGAMGGSQGPTTVNLGPVSSPAAHGTSSPGAGGYQQNVYAQELSSAQRASLEEQQRRESNFGGFGGAGGGTNADMLGGAGGGKNNGMGGGGGADEGVWGAVKGWASGVGTRIAETEEEVWRRINGGGGK